MSRFSVILQVVDASSTDTRPFLGVWPAQVLQSKEKTQAEPRLDSPFRARVLCEPATRVDIIFRPPGFFGGRFNSTSLPAVLSQPGHNPSQVLHTAVTRTNS